MSDVVTKDFHRKIARGEIINNPCLYEKEVISSVDGVVEFTPDTSGQYTVRYEDGNCTYHLLDEYNQLSILDQLTANVSDTISAAKVKALANIDSTPYAFGEDLAELSKTFRYLRNPLKTLADLSKQLKRKRGRLMEQGETFISATAQLWLEYRFAFSPLVRSASDLGDALIDQYPSEPLRRTARGYGSLDQTEELTHVVSGALHFDSYRNVRYDVRSSVLYECPSDRTFMDNLGLRAKDIPYTMWQVLPYSFMVDRVYNVSNIVGAFVNLFDPNVKVLSGSVVVKRDQVNTCAYVSSDPAVVESQVRSFDSIHKKNFSYERTVWNPEASDLVLTDLTPEYLVNDITLTADLLALIYQNLRP